MCDTAVMRANGATWLIKNSDREPDEPQALVWHERVSASAEKSLHTTYLEIPQVSARHAVLLSQPVWLWGGEMGVNEHGVAIGNEAVFSRLVERRASALLGMDLLRLGLERGASAREALDVITTHLMQYGQGGPAGYRDKGFRYDNAYLIADPHQAWVLETAGRFWVAKQVQRWAISNCYSLGSDFDLSSPDLPQQARSLGLWNGKGDFHFARTFDTRLYPFIGGAHARRALNTDALACTVDPGWESMQARLRDHGKHHHDFASHDNRQICLHAGSLLRPSQTTASLVAHLAPGSIRLAATGTSAPCLSLFETLSFNQLSDSSLTVRPGCTVAQTRWAQFEPVHQRALSDPEFLQRLLQDRNSTEARLTALAQETRPDWRAISAPAAQWHQSWHQQADRNRPAQPFFKSGYARWWARRSRRATADSGLQFQC